MEGEGEKLGNDSDSNIDLFDEVEKQRFQDLLSTFVNESKDYVQAIDDCISKLFYAIC